MTTSIHSQYGRAVEIAAVTVSLLASGLARAQAPEPSASDSPSAATTGESSSPAPVPSAPSPQELTAVRSAVSTEERLRALERKFEESQQRSEEQEQTISALSEQLTAAESTGSEDRRLSAWGFMDLTFGRAIYDNANALYSASTPHRWTFMSNGFNVYLKSELSKTLSSMVETRVTYTPVGMVTSTPTNVYINGTYAQTQGDFVREQAASKIPYSYFSYRQHGIFIERAYFDWKPKDWFGIRVGRYLTPFGIWNEDHGAPVVLGIDAPNLINFQLVPTHQLGLQIFGNRLLSDSLHFEYAVTLSNGRGPIDEYKDLDNNKAVGFRGKLIYSINDVTLRLGGYGYYGKYTDSRDQIDIYLTPAFALDRSQPVSLGSSVSITEAYRETIGTLEAMIQFKGLRIMGELAHRRVAYDTAPTLRSDAALLNNVPYGTPIHAASFIGIAYYGMASYELDLGNSLGHTKLTPFVGADHLAPDQTLPYLNLNQYRFGLNAKPSPYVTAKIEVSRTIPRADEMASRAWMLAGQTAVSF